VAPDGPVVIREDPFDRGSADIYADAGVGGSLRGNRRGKTCGQDGRSGDACADDRGPSAKADGARSLLGRVDTPLCENGHGHGRDQVRKELKVEPIDEFGVRRIPADRWGHAVGTGCDRPTCLFDRRNVGQNGNAEFRRGTTDDLLPGLFALPDAVRAADSDHVGAGIAQCAGTFEAWGDPDHPAARLFRQADDWQIRDGANRRDMLRAVDPQPLRAAADGCGRHFDNERRRQQRVLETIDLARHDQVVTNPA